MNLTWRASRSARPYSESRSAGTYLRSRGPRPRESVTPSLSFSSDLSPEQIAVHSMETAERMAERALLRDGDSSPTWLTRTCFSSRNPGAINQRHTRNRFPIKLLGHKMTTSTLDSRELREEGCWVYYCGVDLLYFVDERLGFIRYFYETAAGLFHETKRKIEEHEEPYDDPGYGSEYQDEPPFLEEWENADAAANITGATCLDLLQVNISLFPTPVHAGDRRRSSDSTPQGNEKGKLVWELPRTVPAASRHRVGEKWRRYPVLGAGDLDAQRFLAQP
jgi:hypothetical protein